MPLFDDLSNAVKWVNNVAKDSKENLHKLVIEYATELPRRPPCTLTRTFQQNIDNGRSTYADVPCLDETRIKLATPRDGNDYIHANWVKLPEASCNFILTQAPTKETAVDFWSMVWQERVTLIVCLSKFVEGGRKIGFEYWPTSCGNEYRQKHGRIHMRNLGVRNSRSMALSIIETVHEVTRERRNVMHYLYMDWFEHCLPVCVHSFLDLIEYIENEIRNIQLPTKPTVLIHCTTGAGRSGMLVALRSLMGVVNAGQMPSVPATIAKIRQQRAMAILLVEQYMFVHYALVTYIVNNCVLPQQWKDDVLAKVAYLRVNVPKNACPLCRRSVMGKAAEEKENKNENVKQQQN
ncbi:hypothetical protein M514_07399 [Trichuris suis]|uniref:Protein-tyrosine phosphatase n=1 Tax=Trichuris suis TaxID=68888 RepID=A0A085NC89_9BILA|nr:hypothetical protein M514_07399 [Trichuris suis]